MVYGTTSIQLQELWLTETRGFHNGKHGIISIVSQAEVDS